MENLFSNFSEILKVNEPMCLDLMDNLELENKK